MFGYVWVTMSGFVKSAAYHVSVCVYKHVIYRTRMSTEDIPQTRSAVRNAEANWDRKWAELLKNSILSSVMSADPVSAQTFDSKTYGYPEVKKELWHVRVCVCGALTPIPVPCSVIIGDSVPCCDKVYH